MKSISFKLLVVRAFPRTAELLAFRSFTFPIVIVSGRKSVHEIVQNELPKHVKSVYQPVIPYKLFDPIRLMFGEYTHRSWVVLSGLEPFVKGAEIVVISDLYFFYGYHAARLAKENSKKIVAVLWENKANHLATKIPPYSFLVRYLVRNVDLFILRSEKGHEFTDSIGIPRSKTVVIYQGIDLTRFRPQKSYLTGEIRFLYVGQITKEKGVEDLIRAFKEVHAKFSHIHLDIIGDGPLLSLLKKRYADSAITFHGFMGNELTATFYNAAHVFVSPSISGKFGPFVLYEERFSYTLMEAQGAGCAIIATRCGGIPEEVGRENILVDQGDWHAMAREMEGLITDRRRLAKMGKYSRRRALGHFDPRRQAKRTEESLRNLMYHKV